MFSQLSSIAQYIAVFPHIHSNQAFLSPYIVHQRLLKCAEAMLKREKSTDAEWMVIPRLPIACQRDMIEWEFSKPNRN